MNPIQKFLPGLACASMLLGGCSLVPPMYSSNSEETNQPPPVAVEQKALPALKKPLSIESFNLTKPERVILDKARLELTLRNGGNRRIIAYKLKVRLSTRLKGEIGLAALSSEDSSIMPGDTELATFEFTDNIWARGDAGERLSAASNETLKVTLVDQSVIFDE